MTRYRMVTTVEFEAHDFEAAKERFRRLLESPQPGESELRINAVSGMALDRFAAVSAATPAVSGTPDTKEDEQ
jgi:hypothetical protein